MDIGLSENKEERRNRDLPIKGKSISFRLTFSLILTVALVSCVSIFSNYLNVKSKSRTELVKNLDRNANSLAEILKVPLWTYDQETIENIGNLYSDNDDIMILTIIDSLGKTLFHFERNDSYEIFIESREVMFDGKLAGTVRVALSSKKHRAAIKQLLRSGLMTLVINLSVLILITGFLLRLFLAKPLSMLSEIVNSYASGNYESPKSHLPIIEFQPAVDVIRSMGARITGQIKELQQAEKKFRGIFENAVEGIFQITPQGTFVNANPSLARILGYESPDDLMAAISNVATQCFESPDDFKKIITAILEKGTVSGYEVRGLRKNKTRFWMSISARAAGEDTLEGSIIDISDRKEKEEAEKRQKAADAANQAKTMFIARMSHELRTPLNSVLGMTEMLMETHLSEDQVEYIKMLQSSGEFLESIINDILDFSKIEAQQLILEQIPFSLTEIVRDVTDLVSVRAKGKDLSIITTIDPQICPLLIGDPVRLKQILINLAGNAVKFTRKGHVTITVEKVRSESTSEGYDDILFQVSDSGIGIPESKLESIFESFTQADSFVKRQYGGTGLGLSICKRLVELMGGRLGVTSREDSGSVFSFSLLFRQGPAKIEPLQGTVAILDHHLPPLAILLADDIEPNRTVVHRFLQNAPVTITDAENGQEAVDLFYKHAFDLVLMDVEMPLMSGLEATRLIRQREKETHQPPTPLIILSAHAFGEHRRQCFDAGCNDLLVKPIRKNDLIRAIQTQTSKEPPCIETTRTEESTIQKAPADQPTQSWEVLIDVMFEDLLDGFFSYFEESLARMDQAADERNFDDLFRLSHGLKGSSRNYEFLKLGDIFFELEKAATDKNLDDIRYYLSQAREYLDQVDVKFIDKG